MSNQGSQKGKVNPEAFNPLPVNVDITFKNISYTVKTKEGPKQILKGIDGICKGSSLSAILGSSGAGKTTLLNILCKRVGSGKGNSLEGEIMANSQTYSSDKFAKFAAYVMQDDILLETMTVKECFEFAANLKTIGTLEEKAEKVTQIIKSLRLEKCQNTFVGGLFVKGISGGEKKRTSIGYELVSDPTCIFLDEPTSGLDSFTAYSIINLLKSYAHEQHKTVVFTIHQPSSDIWQMFDNVMLMVEGKFIYQGQGGLNVVNHFESIGFKCPTFSNPADFLMSIMHQGSETNTKNYQVYYEGYNSKLKPIVDKDIQIMVSSSIPEKEITTSSFYQMSQIAQRQIKVLKRNPILFKARFFQSILIALFIGAIYWNLPTPESQPSMRQVQDKLGFLFFFCVGMFMMSLNPCMLTFPAQRAVFSREENAKLYSVTPYFFGKLLIDFVPTVLFPTLSTLVIYWMVGLNDESTEKFFFFLLTIIIQSCTGLGIGYFGGTAFSDAKIAIAVTPLLIMPFMLFAGFYKNQADYADWIGWIQFISPFKYSFQAVAINELTYEKGGYKQDPLKILNFQQTKWESVGCLAGLFGSFTILGYFFLATLKKKIQ